MKPASILVLVVAARAATVPSRQLPPAAVEGIAYTSVEPAQGPPMGLSAASPAPASLAAPGAAYGPTPMDKVVQLIKGLKFGITKDGKQEQEVFDKYACWCENTMERKASDISHSKDVIAETQTLIKKLKAELASHGAEIAQLKKDIAQNQEAVNEATELRNKEHAEFVAENMETLQCIGALEVAIKVLTGAGTKSFLQSTMHEAELLSVIAGVRTALNSKVTATLLSSKDIETMKHFVSKPDDFVETHAKTMSAAQVGPNPFGDYAPQSSQIQGILAAMLDAFKADTEKDIAAEAESLKSFKDLMATKNQERETLDTTQQKQETDEAAKNKKLSESEVLLDDTMTDLKNDEQFADDTKEACQAKATEWSVRTRLRTEELNGMQVAIKILSSKDAKKTFGKSTTTFLQIAAAHKNTEHSSERSKAYAQLKMLASQFHSRSVAKIAAEVKTGGHFDKVIIMVDEMMVVLRKEEADDIAHRDRCENSENANKNELADLAADIQKTNHSIKRMENTEKDQTADIKEMEGEIAATKDDMAQLLKFRNEEEADFKQALKDDSDAVGLLKQAIAALTKYYTDNKIALPALVQKGPEYAQDEDKAPDATFASSDSRKSESGGILAILAMLVEDTEKEIAEGRSDNADAQEKYMKQNGALTDTRDSEDEAKANLETEKADLEEKIAAYEKHKNGRKADQEGEEGTQAALGTDCAWVKSNFQSRRDKRKTEMQGLVDAKAFLSGTSELP